jgi:cyclin D5, plant
MGAEDYATGCCFSLLCQEDGADLGDGFTNDEGGNLLLMYSAGAADDGEEDEEGYMDHLVSKESSFCSADPLPSMASEEWFQCARGDAVRWILEVNDRTDASIYLHPLFS